MLACVFGIVFGLALRNNFVFDLRLILHEFNRGNLPGRWRRDQEEEGKNEADY